MNLEVEVFKRVAVLFGVAYLLSVFVAHTVEVARKFAPKDAQGNSKIDGWKVPVVALVASGVISFLLIRPSTADAGYDTATVAVFAAMGAVGGDAWIRKVMRMLVKPAGSWRDEMPTRPEGKGVLPP